MNIYAHRFSGKQIDFFFFLITNSALMGKTLKGMRHILYWKWISIKLSVKTDILPWYRESMELSFRKPY